jgi:hypothetical protein
MVLRQMQGLLAQCYDTPSAYDIYEFLTTDRNSCGLAEDCTDEQVLVSDTCDGPRLSVFIDSQVLSRLAASNPIDDLNEENLADYCTALEGVSHFHYLTWRIDNRLPVTLLELELQAEVDKYVAALVLYTRQRSGEYPAQLHRRMFDCVGFAEGLCVESLARYRIANRNAARYCRRLDEKFLRVRSKRPEAWLMELRRFYRCGHAEKVRRAAA